MCLTNTFNKKAILKVECSMQIMKNTKIKWKGTERPSSIEWSLSFFLEVILGPRIFPTVNSTQQNICYSCMNLIKKTCKVLEAETINLFKHKCLKTLLKTVSKLTSMFHQQHKKERLKILLNFIVHNLQAKKELTRKLIQMNLKKRLDNTKNIRESHQCLNHKSIKSKAANKTATLQIVIGEVVRLLCK